MRSSTPISLWLICMLHSMGVLVAKENSSAMRIQFNHDFGQVEVAKEYTHTFVINNNFGRELNIKHVTKTCGCLDSSLSRHKIPPDENFSVKLTMRINEVAQGKYNQEMTLIDPQNPPIFIRLQVSGHLRTDARLTSEPKTIDIRTISSGTSLVDYFYLERVDGGPLLLASVETTHPAIKAYPLALRSTGAAQRKYFKLTVDASTLKTGPFNERVLIRTIHPTFTDLAIHIRGHCVADVSSNPSQFFLGYVPKHPTRKWCLHLESASRSDFAIVKPTHTLGEAWKLTATTQALELSYIGDEARHLIRGHVYIEITFDDRRTESLAIPVIGCL